MALTINDTTARCAEDVLTKQHSRPYAHPLLRRIAGAWDPRTIYTCAHIRISGLHTHDYYIGGYCRACKSLRDQDIADDFYAQMKAELDERAPA